MASFSDLDFVRVLAVGYSTAPLDSGPLLENWLSDVKAPSNYKDPKVIADYIEKERIKRLANAGSTPMLCRFDGNVVVLDSDGSALKPSDCAKTPGEAFSLLTWLDRLWRKSAEDEKVIEVAVLGAPLFVHLLIQSHLGTGGSLSPYPWLFRSGRSEFSFTRFGLPADDGFDDNDGWQFYDPARLLAGTSIFDDRPELLAASFGFAAFKEWADESVAERRARIALHLARAMGRTA